MKKAIVDYRTEIRAKDVCSKEKRKGETPFQKYEQESDKQGIQISEKSLS
jgi:hypothetical protein